MTIRTVVPTVVGGDVHTVQLQLEPNRTPHRSELHHAAGSGVQIRNRHPVYVTGR
jgi:hypothetical protein